MAYLIDRNKLYNHIKTEINPYGKPFKGSAYEFGVKLMDDLMEMEVVDAKPIVHGKWLRSTEYDIDDNAYFVCSNCNHGDKHAKSVVVPFCWFCGAYMKGDFDD